jgi:dihydrofolate reductase
MKTNKQKVGLVVAFDKEGGFGKDEYIPWNFPEDFKHFATTTKNSTVIMGRTTYDDIRTYSIGSKSLLKGRQCIVVTSKGVEGGYDNVETVKSVEDALEAAKKYDKDVFFVGGERIYREGIEHSDILHITAVDGHYECDRFFPLDRLVDFELVSEIYSTRHKELTYQTYRRKE